MAKLQPQLHEVVVQGLEVIATQVVMDVPQPDVIATDLLDVIDLPAED